MRFVFASNFLNHHQLPFCLAMVKTLGEDNFTFIASEPFNEKRLAAGYKDLNSAYDWVIRSYQDAASSERARKAIREADCAILSPELIGYSKIRAKCNGPTFLYTERILKKGDWWRFAPPKMLRTHCRYNQFRKLPFYALCSGAYAARDLDLSGFPAQKCFTWAYFIEVPVSPNKIFCRKRPKILWVGRMLGWKHPLDLLKAAKRLLSEGLEFDLYYVGVGEEMSALEAYAREHNLQDILHFLGSLPNEETRAVMEDADIFVATSDRREGWGAVVGEAMASSCAVLASGAMGASWSLIESERNGLIYQSGNIEDLTEKLARLIMDSEYRNQLQICAYETMRDEWNADVAAYRIIALAHALNEGATVPFESGPCSVAKSPAHR